MDVANSLRGKYLPNTCLSLAAIEIESQTHYASLSHEEAGKLADGSFCSCVRVLGVSVQSLFSLQQTLPSSQTCANIGIISECMVMPKERT